MKSSTLSLTVVCGIVVFLEACNNSSAKWKIKTEYHITKHYFNGQEYIDGGTTDTFYYKKDGIKYRPDGKTITTEELQGNMIETKTTDRNGTVINSSTTFLNEKGLEDSLISLDPVVGNYIHKYIYNEEGKLVEDRMYPPRGPKMIFKYIFKDGNVVEERIIPMSSVDTSFIPNPVTGASDQVLTIYENFLIYNEFFPDKPNMPTSENFGYQYDTSPTRLSKNLKKRSAQVSSKGDTTDVFDYRYQFDDKGRVISVVQNSRSREVYDSTYYSYY